MFGGLPKWLADVLRAVLIAVLGALADGALLAGKVSGVAQRVVSVVADAPAPGAGTPSVSK